MLIRRPFSSGEEDMKLYRVKITSRGRANTVSGWVYSGEDFPHATHWTWDEKKSGRWPLKMARDIASWWGDYSWDCAPEEVEG